MRRTVVILALVGGCALVPAAASGGQLERACQNVYEPNRATLVGLGGDPGRDVCRQGADPGKHPTLAAVDRSNRVLEADIGVLMPPAALAPSSGEPSGQSAAPSSTSTVASVASSGGLAACVAAHEHGPGDNADNGGGDFQFEQGTWEAAGGTRYASSAAAATPAQQAEVFSGWVASHPDAWQADRAACGF